MTIKAREVISSAIVLIERGWSQKAVARRADGTPCGPADTDAAAWCLTGALYRRVDYRVFPADACNAERLIRSVIGLRSGVDEHGKPIHEGTTQWNDDPKRTVVDVLAALHSAEQWISRLQAPS